MAARLALRVARTVLPLLVVLVVLAFARAARAEPRRVTFADAIAAAGAAPAAHVPEHEIAAADAEVAAAGAWPSPSVHVETTRVTAQLIAGLTLPLPLFGTVGATRDVARAQARITRADARVASRELERRVAQLWIALARADSDVEVTATAAKQAAELEVIARGRLDAGTGAEVDVTVAHAARARADVAAAAAEREAAAASAQLAGALGWDPTARLQSDGAADVGTDEEIAALRGGLAHHPERVAAAERVGAADATVARVRVDWFPSVALEGQVSLNDPTTPGTDVLVGVVLDVPVFAHVGDRTRAAEASADAERARLATVETTLRGDLVAAYLRWQAATSAPRRARARRRARAGEGGDPVRAGVSRRRARPRERAPGRARPRGGARGDQRGARGRGARVRGAARGGGRMTTARVLSRL